MSQYRPGVCNIGPAEVARRRRAGHVGAVLSVALVSGLVVAGAPRWSRLAVALPATLAASGYLQAHAHFCAGFGSRGQYNFGPLGHVEQVADPHARARDAATSHRIGVRSLAVGVAAAAVATALPR